MSGGRVLAIYGHEGDWERISLRLDARDRPVEAAFYQHHGEPSTANRRIIPWAGVELENGHPVVFIGRGTHASFPGPSRLPNDHRNRGWRWPAERRLRDVTTEPWYGFGGAWGAVGTGGESVGPSGPGPNGLGCHKPAAPRIWLPLGRCG